MTNAVRWLAGFLAVGLLAAAVISFLQAFTGEEPGSYVASCVLAVAAAGGGWFAWFFQPAAQVTEGCGADSEDGDHHSLVEREGSDAA